MVEQEIFNSMVLAVLVGGIIILSFVKWFAWTKKLDKAQKAWKDNIYSKIDKIEKIISKENKTP